jgi:hypothetical protein
MPPRLGVPGQPHLVLGGRAEPSDKPAPALLASYLVLQPAAVPAGFRALVERAVDREQLARDFAGPGAVALRSLLPASPGDPVGAPPEARASPAPPPPAPGQPLRLVYDPSVEGHQVIAQRILVKLGDRGQRVALQAMQRPALAAAWARGDFDLLLLPLLLPPAPTLGLAVLLEAAGRADLLAAELSGLGAVDDAAARRVKALERARALEPTLPLIPLYAQPLTVQAAASVQGLVLDGQGLPRLELLSLEP